MNFKLLYSKDFIFSFLLTFSLLLGCKNSPKEIPKYFDYGTSSDSARHYYLEGWKKIMDEGRWTESEEAFRKAAEYDDDFALGKVLVGRISRDLSERKEILKEIENIALPEDEAAELLIEIYRNSVAFMNYREQRVEINRDMRAKKDSIAEFNHRRFLNIHPESNYEKAEYIEILHYKYGAQVAIDTLRQITNDKNRSIPFFISYEAILEAELGNFGRSGKLINKLDSFLDENAPARYFTRASVYESMDSMAYSKALAEQAYQLDTNHLLAKAMIERLSGIETPRREEIGKDEVVN